MFHINGKGEAGKCSASKGNCPFGEVEDHFASAEDARASYERSMANHPAGRGRQKVANSDLAIYGDLTSAAKYKVSEAQSAFNRAEEKMNATANYEGVSSLTKEGSARASAVAAHEKATERLAKAKEFVSGLERIHEAVNRIDKGEPTVKGSRYSGKATPANFEQVQVGDVIEMKPFKSTGSNFHNKLRALVIGKTAKSVKTIYVENEYEQPNGEFAFLDEEKAIFKPSEANYPSTWHGKDIAAIVVPER